MSHPDLAALVEAVVRATREGRVLAVREVWQEGEGELLSSLDGSGIAWIREGEDCYLYSTELMTCEYAGMAARVASGNLLRLIAVTVRYDSETYPRPTFLETLQTEPYSFTAEQVRAAVEGLSGDPEYADIRKANASDGSVYLYSSRYLDESRAASLAERLAVGRHENP